MKTFEKNVGKFCFVIWALCIVGIARAQAAQPWDTNILSWVLPSACSSGEPISACPLTGIRVEEATSATGAYRTLATLGANATTYTHSSATAGPHYYRVFALSANGESLPSNVATKTNVKPVGPPNPPVLKAIDAVAYNVKADFLHFAYVRGSKAGAVKLGAACDESRQTSDGYTVISRLTQVTPRPAAGTVLVARCG